MTIHVKQEHIERGIRAIPSCCPIASAMRDAGFGEVMVRETLIEAEGFVYPMPDSAYQFALEFDMFGHGKPFSFDLPV